MAAARQSVDLLSVHTVPSQGIQRQGGKFTVSTPWASLGLQPLSLRSGWYCLRAEGRDTAVCLQLSNSDKHTIIELTTSDLAEVYVRLDSASYQARLIVGARPGQYEVDRLELSAVSGLELAELFAGRAVAAIKAGMTPAKLLRTALRALRPHGTFGVRATPEVKGSTGPMTKNDFSRVSGGRHRYPEPKADGPIFLVHPSSPGEPVPGLETQSYSKYTLDPAQAHDAICYVDNRETLTPDALATFAEILSRPGISAAIADVWIGAQPTTRVAFDPLFYGINYPTPYAIRKGFDYSGAWPEQLPQFAVTGFPLASADSLTSAPNAVPPPPFAEKIPVSVIIPTRDRADLLAVALQGLLETTDWPVEVIVVDNGSIEPETFALFDTYRARGIKIIAADVPFNFATLSNLGANAARHPYLVFMNNDVELFRADWLSHMMRLATRSDIGAVGARLYYPDKRLQHAGIGLGMTQLCGHPWRGWSLKDQEAEDRICRDSLRSAVTAALLCVSRERFFEVGGFDEVSFPVTLNDVDLCLKLNSKGWLTAYASQAEAFHHEGESRGEDSDPAKQARRLAELDAFALKWPGALANDPWISEAICKATESFDLR